MTKELRTKRHHLTLSPILFDSNFPIPLWDSSHNQQLTLCSRYFHIPKIPLTLPHIYPFIRVSTFSITKIILSSHKLHNRILHTIVHNHGFWDPISKSSLTLLKALLLFCFHLNKSYRSWHVPHDPMILLFGKSLSFDPSNNQCTCINLDRRLTWSIVSSWSTPQCWGSTMKLSLCLLLSPRIQCGSPLTSKNLLRSMLCFVFKDIGGSN